MDAQVVVPEDVQVVAKPQRRTYPAEYKRRILQEADACMTPGAVGALLRREGLYSSHLVAWRRARARGELAALTPKKRGRKPTRVDPRDRKIAELERQLAFMTGQHPRDHGLVTKRITDERNMGDRMATPLQCSRSE